LTRSLRIHPPALDPAFDLAARQVERGEAPFVILAVAGADGPIRAEAFAGPARPGAQLDSLCAIASITKPIVATAVMQLVEAGRLLLTEPVDHHVPEFGALGKPPVNAWHLLSHTSGIEEYDYEAFFARRASWAELLAEVCRAPIRTPPGTRYSYASNTFQVLAELIARIEGEPHAPYLARRLFGPLGMHSTTFNPFAFRERVIVPMGEPLAGPAARSPIPLGGEDDGRYMATIALPGGGLWSTAGDLVRFGRAFLREGELDGTRILSPAWVRLMTAETTIDGIGRAEDPTASHHYALGWGKPDGRTLPASPLAFGHRGYSGTMLWIDPAFDLVFVYLSGAWGFPTRPMDAVMNAVYSALR
jgi:CubicO group peptidase (beta-lactamase class C family)